MTLYLAVVNDRHFDPFHRVFTDRATAVAWADRNFRRCVATPDEIEVETLDPGQYEWYATYLEEGDHALVQELILDDSDDIRG